MRSFIHMGQRAYIECPECRIKLDTLSIGHTSDNPNAIIVMSGQRSNLIKMKAIEFHWTTLKRDILRLFFNKPIHDCWLAHKKELTNLRRSYCANCRHHFDDFYSLHLLFSIIDNKFNIIHQCGFKSVKKAGKPIYTC